MHALDLVLAHETSIRLEFATHLGHLFTSQPVIRVALASLFTQVYNYLAWCVRPCVSCLRLRFPRLHPRHKLCRRSQRRSLLPTRRDETRRIRGRGRGDWRRHGRERRAWVWTGAFFIANIMSRVLLKPLQGADGRNCVSSVGTASISSIAVRWPLCYWSINVDRAYHR